MPNWLLILILVIVVVGVLLSLVAMFTEMGTKRATGKMKGNRAKTSKAPGHGGKKKRK